MAIMLFIGSKNRKLLKHKKKIRPSYSVSDSLFIA